LAKYGRVGSAAGVAMAVIGGAFVVAREELVEEEDEQEAVEVELAVDEVLIKLGSVGWD